MTEVVANYISKKMENKNIDVDAFCTKILHVSVLL